MGPQEGGFWGDSSLKGEYAHFGEREGEGGGDRPVVRRVRGSIESLNGAHKCHVTTVNVLHEW